MTEEEQSALELQALQRVIASGGRARGLDVVLERCLEQALKVARCETGCIYLRDEKRASYRLAHRRNLDPRMTAPTIEVRPMDERFAREHLLLDLRALAHVADPALRGAIALDFTHALFLMLRVEQQRVGFVALVFRGAPELAESTLRTLEAIAAFEAVAIESARVHRQIERRAQLGHILIDCGERLLDPDADVPALVLETACKIARADRAFLSEMFVKDGVEYARIAHGVGKDAPIVGMVQPTSAPHLREWLAQSAPTVIEDTSTLDPESVVGQVVKKNATAAFVLLTMRERGRPLGQLFAGSGEPRVYDEAEIDGLQLLANMGAHALERARRHAEERAQHERIADILEHLPIVVAVADRSGQIVHINAAGRSFATRMGTEGNDWRAGLASVEVYDREGHFVPIEERGMMRAFAGLTTERDLTLVGKNGLRVHIRAVSSPLTSADGSIQAVQTSFQDVTELRELADAKDRFLSIASHELRSPITSLRATTSLLQIDPTAVADDERRGVLLARIQRQVDRLSTLVERLLDTTRLNAGELPLEYGDGDLAELCRGAVELARLTDRDHSYALKAEGVLDGRWDLARIEQVLTNLLNNASRYSPAGSEIRVQARLDGDNAIVDVIDRGAGVAVDQLEKLFTPFYRGPGATRHKGGLGLGLFITREIVRRHGGAMHVTSKPGEGSTFTVELPRRPKMG
jgi:signal transduction histidine kinase